MKSSGWFYLILLDVVSSADAQQLAPAPVNLTYRFHPGQKLHYQAREERRTPSNPDEFTWANYNRVEDTHVTVLAVDSKGNATLLVQNELSYVDVGLGEGSKEQTLSEIANPLQNPPAGSKPVMRQVGGRWKSIPSYTITIDPYGNYVSGQVYVWSPADSFFIKESKKPHWNGFRPPDSTQIARSFAELMPARPRMRNTTPGSHQIDSVYVDSHPHTFSLVGLSAATAPDPEDSKPSYRKQWMDYNFVQGIRERDASEYRLILNQHGDEFALGDYVARWTVMQDEHIRTSDGLSKARTSSHENVVFSNNGPSMTKRTVTLISEE